MERLHTLDASFLYLEDDNTPMHIGGLCIFDGPAPSRDDLKQLYASRLSQFPRYRQRVQTLPLGLGRPVWFDDPHFDLDYHVRATALAHPGDDGTLCTLMGRLMAQRLDRERPLWEAWIVEGLTEGRWALISKVHHAMVDGVAGASLLIALLDERADAPVPAAAPWRPQDPPSPGALLGASLRDARAETGTWVRNALGALRDPVKAGRDVRDLGLGLVRMRRSLRTASDVSLRGSVGLHRSYAFTRSALADLQTVRQAFGGTLNDVVLAILAGAYRVLMLHQGDDVAHAPIQSLVPVSVRHADGAQALDNQVAALVCDLPVHLADPADRLSFVREHMNALKASHIAEASAFLVRIGDLAPPLAVSAVTRLSALLMRHFPQRAISTVTTHVPGPRRPLYLLGRRLLAYLPYVPLAHGTRIGTAILTFDGKVGYGITADPDHVPDLTLFTRAIEADTDVLVQRARAKLAEATSR